MDTQQEILIRYKTQLKNLLVDIRQRTGSINALVFTSDLQIENWDDLLENFIKYTPNLQELRFVKQEICGESLCKIKKFRSLKKLSLHACIIDKPLFFDQLPPSLIELDLSKVSALQLHSAPKLAQLLTTLPNLTLLNLAETHITAFPRLDQPHSNLTTLELYHHTICSQNKSLNDQDLANIAYNFPNLNNLNIEACQSIKIDDGITRETIETFAENEDFKLEATAEIQYYFDQCQSTDFLIKYFDLPQQTKLNIVINDKKLTSLTDYKAKFLINELKIEPKELVEIYEKTPIKFNLLTLPGMIEAFKNDYLSYDKFNTLYDTYGDKLKILVNFYSFFLVNEKDVAFASLLSLFEKNSEYYSYILSTSRFSKSSEMIEAEIAMLVKDDPNDPSIFKKLDKQNCYLRSYILNFSKEVELSGQDIANILYNFPELKRLEIRSNIALKKSEQDITIAKQALEKYCLNHLSFEIHVFTSDPLINALYQRTQGICFYVQQFEIPIDDLHFMELNDPLQFHLFMQPSIQTYMIKFEVGFAEMSKLYLLHQNNLLKFTSYNAQRFIKNGLLTFDNIIELFRSDPQEFEKTITYGNFCLIDVYGISIDQLHQIYEQDPTLLKLLDQFTLTNSNIKETKALLKTNIIDNFNPSFFKPSLPNNDESSQFLRIPVKKNHF